MRSRGLSLSLVVPLLIDYLRGLRVCALQTLVISRTGLLSVALHILSSWSFLFTQYGYGDNQDGAIGARSYPLDYVMPGYYVFGMGRLYQQTTIGYNYSQSIKSAAASFISAVGGRLYQIGNSHSKYNANNLRCSKK